MEKEAVTSDATAAVAQPAGQDRPATATPTICPYLGRRQHPAQAYTYATSSNVCYASPHREHAYSHVDRRHQMGVCLEAVDGWATCRAFQNAVAKGIEAPRELPAGAGQLVRTRMRRRRKRRSHRRWRHLWQRSVVVLAVLAVSALLGWLVARLSG